MLVITIIVKNNVTYVRITPQRTYHWFSTLHVNVDYTEAGLNHTHHE